MYYHYNLNSKSEKINIGVMGSWIDNENPLNESIQSLELLF
jgi:hypothetical protein